MVGPRTTAPLPATETRHLSQGDRQEKRTPLLVTSSASPGPLEERPGPASRPQRPATTRSGLRGVPGPAPRQGGRARPLRAAAKAGADPAAGPRADRCEAPSPAAPVALTGARAHGSPRLPVRGLPLRLCRWPLLRGRSRAETVADEQKSPQPSETADCPGRNVPLSEAACRRHGVCSSPATPPATPPASRARGSPRHSQTQRGSHGAGRLYHWEN